MNAEASIDNKYCYRLPKTDAQLATSVSNVMLMLLVNLVCSYC